MINEVVIAFWSGPHGPREIEKNRIEGPGAGGTLDRASTADMVGNSG